MDATAKLIAIVALAAFATERLIAAATYLINAERLARVRTGAAVRLRMRERRKLLLFALGGAVAALVVDRADLRILRLLQIGAAYPAIDALLTWLIVFAGADRIGALVQDAPASPAAAAPVVEVKLDDGEIRTLKRVS